jgi:hypothetical protein
VLIRVYAPDGEELLGIEVLADGRLDVTGPEERWTEGCRLFVEEIRRLAGLTG